MNISVGSLRRPIFFTSLVILMLVVGFTAFQKMPVTLMPNVDIPYIVVTTQYPGAGPKEVESVVTKPLEEELTSLEGLKKIKSTSQDSFSTIELEYHMGLSVDTLEQKVRDRIALVKPNLPAAIKESSVQKYDANSSPVVTMAIRSQSLDRVKLTDWVERELKPQLAQIPRIGKLEVLGGQKREIHVDLDPAKLERYRLSLTTVSDAIGTSGINLPGGLVRKNGVEVGVRSLGEYSSIETVSNRVVSFRSGEFPIRVSDIGTVRDSAERESTRAFYGDDSALIVDVYRQSGANVVEISDLLKKRVSEISGTLVNSGSDITLDVVVDGSKEIRDNVWDVQETIIIGILLTVLVVYLFLASARSTLITGLAIPNSLIGAFILMYLMGFSINIMTLLALSLAVGLLVDDAIVVRENIFKHIEIGKTPLRAALDGVREVSLAVIATTIAIISVFGPVAFIPGIIGQFFKEFGLTVSFAMLISLFDALTIAPMLSAYWAGNPHAKKNVDSIFYKMSLPFTKLTSAFGRFQDGLETGYERILAGFFKRFKTSTAIAIGVSVGLLGIVVMLPSTFMPDAEPVGVIATVNLPPGTPLDDSEKVGKSLVRFGKDQPGMKDSLLTIGNSSLESHVINVKFNFKPAGEREEKGSEIMEKLRVYLNELKTTLPETSEVLLVKSDGTGTVAAFPVSFSLLANDSATATKYAAEIVAALQKSALLRDVNSTDKAGRPELTVQIDSNKAGKFGVSESLVGLEIRGRIEGSLSGRYRDDGREYDIRVKMEDGSERFLSQLDKILVPNLDLTPIRLKDVSTVTQGQSIAKLERMNRSAAISIRATLAPGVGLGEATAEVERVIHNEVKIPKDVKILYEGDADSFNEMATGFAAAMGFGVILLYLVLASLYESFLVPFLVMSALPLAAGGAFVALLLMGQGIDMYSMIGILLLMGVATKNSILIVDTVTEKLREISNITRETYIKVVLESAVRRLRPIIMTSMALIAGMVPIAVGLNEASAQRTSMGTAVIGGTISSTALTLILLPLLLLLVQNRVARAASAAGKRNQAVDKALEESANDMKKHQMAINHQSESDI